MKPYECGSCRREVIRRDSKDKPLYFYNLKLHKWFTKPLKVPPLKKTFRLHVHTNMLRPILVWACKCGYLNEYHAQETFYKKTKSPSVQVQSMDRSTP